jgi:hypothetical protein
VLSTLFPLVEVMAIHVQLVIGIFHLGVLFWMSKYHIATGFCLLDRMVLSQPVLPWEKPDAFFFSE